MEIRDVIVDFIGKYGAKTDLPDSFFTKEIGIRKDRLCE